MLGDNWKFWPNLTVTVGVQYVRDSGRSDSDLPAIPCSAVAASYGILTPCTGNGDLLTHFGGNSLTGRPGAPARHEFRSAVWPGMGPGKNGQTVIRAGIGMYYDNNVFRNLLGDRAARLANGQFNAQANDPCASHGVVIFPGNVANPILCPLWTAIGNVATADREPANRFPGGQCAPEFKLPNPSFLGQSLNSQLGLLAPGLPDSAFATDEHRAAETVVGGDPV